MVPHMNLITIRKGKLFLAQFACIRFFSRMDSLMFVTVASAYETFLTILARKRLFASVDFQMGIEHTFISITFMTHIAIMQFDFVVVLTLSFDVFVP